MGRMVGNPVGDIRKSVSFMAFVMFTNKKTILKFCPKEKKNASILIPMLSVSPEKLRT